MPDRSESRPKIALTGLTSLPPPSAAASGQLGQYQPLVAYLAEQAAARASSATLSSVVLTPGSRLDAPAFDPCGQKPLAVIFNLDEAETANGDPDARWRRWKGDGSDSVVVARGAVEAVAAVRRSGVIVIYASARSPAGAAGITALLDHLGLGPAELGNTLFLHADSKTVGIDDAVRQAIAARYCVIAIAGDESSDFSNQIGIGGGRAITPRAATSGTRLTSLWDAGWFMLPNPIRSTNIAAAAQ